MSAQRNYPNSSFSPQRSNGSFDSGLRSGQQTPRSEEYDREHLEELVNGAFKAHFELLQKTPGNVKSDIETLWKIVGYNTASVDGCYQELCKQYNNPTQLGIPTSQVMQARECMLDYMHNEILRAVPVAKLSKTDVTLKSWNKSKAEENISKRGNEIVIPEEITAPRRKTPEEEALSTQLNELRLAVRAFNKSQQKT